MFLVYGALFLLLRLGLFAIDEADWWEVHVWLEHGHVDYLIDCLKART